MLTDKPFRDLLAAFSAPDPTPGGGSASALASAVGVSLLEMVARLPKTRSGSAEDHRALQAAAAALEGLRQELTDAVDTDASAYTRVVGALGLPRSTEHELLTRRAAIQEATAGAARIPLSVMRLSAAALAAAKEVAAHGNRSAASDVGVAIALIRAGLHGARLNVEINVKALKNETLAAGLRADAERIAAEAAGAAADAEDSLGTG
jgi:formiminotetrahydrofolate cyclodeaminase